MRNFLSEMLYALTSAYTRKDYDNFKQGLPLETNIGKLFYILAWGLDSVQEQAELIKLWDDLDNAKGKVLDRYGANFGVQRVSSDDRFYRLAIKVKMMALLSGGDTDTVLTAAGTLLDVELSDVELEDVYPAKIALYVDMELLSQDRIELIEEIANSIKRILAAGVGMRLYLRTYRTYRAELIFLHCGYAVSEFTAVPVSQDRLHTETLNISHGSFAETAFTYTPTAKDRTARQPVQLARGAYQTPRTINNPPDTKRALRGQQSSAGGVVYHTHIKSKRID